MTRQRVATKQTWSRARGWLELRGSKQQREPTGKSRQRPSRTHTEVRAALLALVVALDAVAFATVLRPPNGYPNTDRLLVVLAIGVGAALAALTVAGAVLRRLGDRSLWLATTSLPSASFVLAIFVAAAVASQVVQAIRPPANNSASSAAVTRAEFQRWQQTVIPIVVRWQDALQGDSAFTHGLPSRSRAEIGRRVARSARTLDRLAHSLAVDSPRLPQPPDLRRLTKRLETALVFARHAQRSYALALAVERQGGAARAGGAARIRGLIARGNAEAQRSLAIMAAFSFDANKLGGSLFLGQP